MKLLVTGRHGQLAECLAAQGQQDPKIELIFASRPHVDLEVAGSLATAILEQRPHVVVNAAAYTAVDQAEDEPDRAWRINAEAAGEAAAAAHEVGAAIIQISTDYVFNGRSERAYRESDPVEPLGVYGRTKLAGEEYVRAANPRHAIVRTAWVYSPFGRNFVKSIVAAARTRDRLTVVDDQVGSPTSALNLADAVLTLARRWQAGETVGLGQTYHVAGAGMTSWFGLAARVMAEWRDLGLPAADVEPIRTEDWPTRAVRPAWSVLDSGKFAAETGFAMPHWESSLRSVLQQLCREGAE